MHKIIAGTLEGFVVSDHKDSRQVKITTPIRLNASEINYLGSNIVKVVLEELSIAEWCCARERIRKPSLVVSDYCKCLRLLAS